MGSQSSSAPIVVALQRLVRDGWLPLRQLSFLLGYAHPTTVYGRLRGKNAIATIKVGSTHRIYADEVVRVLESVPEKDRHASAAILSKYRQLLAEHQEKDNE